MKINAQTTRKGHPVTALNICVDTVQRIALAYRSGTVLRLEYTNLKGETSTRQCYIESINQTLKQVTIKHRDFGYRTVCMERLKLV